MRWQPTRKRCGIRSRGFGYIGYHTVFFLDYYLSEYPNYFAPPAPFTLSEFDPAGVLPDRIYTCEDLLDYLSFCREKCRQLIAVLTDERMVLWFVSYNRDYSMLEVLMYNMLHVQHYTAQLNLLLRQGGVDAPAWVSRTEAELWAVNEGL